MNKRLFEKLKNWNCSGLSEKDKAIEWKKKVEAYNEDPFKCELCGKVIPVIDRSQLHDKMRTYEKSGRVFCCQAHAATYNNTNSSEERYEKRTKTLWMKEKEYSLTDKQIKDAYKKATSVRHFLRLSNLKKKEATAQLLDRMDKLNLDISLIKVGKKKQEDE